MCRDDYIDNEVKEYEEWFINNDKLLNSELAAIKKLIQSYGKGIEIGVGTGIFASKLGIRYGIDPSEIMAAEARKKGIHVDIQHFRFKILKSLILMTPLTFQHM